MLDAAPICLWGEAHACPKGYFVGTHRLRAPHETFQLIEPHLSTAGVTRIADITGLDKIGVPTTLALRPNSPTMACSSGKGLTIDAAKVSGAMEAIELYAAETMSIPAIRASYEEMASNFQVPEEGDLPLARRSLYNREWPFRWALGWDLMSQREFAVPLSILEMSRKPSRVADLGAFQVTSNGLASGNSLLEAVAAALYEVVERDAIACHRAAWEADALKLQTCGDAMLREYPLVAELLNLCDRADVKAIIFDCIVDTGIPTYDVYVYDTFYEGLGLFHGHGTHLDPEIALVRALTEAMQGRLNFIAGSRDDIFRAAFSRVHASGTARVVEALAREAREAAPAQHRPSGATDTFEGDLAEVLQRLRRAQVEHVVVYDITPAGFPVHVVRVVVPGLEGYTHFGYTPGRRARRCSEAGL